MTVSSFSVVRSAAAALSLSLLCVVLLQPSAFNRQMGLVNAQFFDDDFDDTDYGDYCDYCDPSWEYDCYEYCYYEDEYWYEYWEEEGEYYEEENDFDIFSLPNKNQNLNVNSGLGNRRSVSVSSEMTPRGVRRTVSTFGYPQQSSRKSFYYPYFNKNYFYPAQQRGGQRKGGYSGNAPTRRRNKSNYGGYGSTPQTYNKRNPQRYQDENENVMTLIDLEYPAQQQMRGTTPPRQQRQQPQRHRQSHSGPFGGKGPFGGHGHHGDDNGPLADGPELP